MAKVKKSFDRELMYKKIMPTNMRKSSEQTAEDEKISDGEEDLSQKEANISINADTIYIYENPDDVKNETKNSERDETAVQNNSDNEIGEKRGIILCNIMEKLVLEKLDIAMKKMNCCKCERCREDIIALALNSLKPMYIVATREEIADKVEELDRQGLEVTTAVLKAVLFIRKNPRH